ncbi:MAG: Amidohydrolase [Firmicutes bacterium ADurb.Bin419]|nr:MAG: Amidohydrolase [Firmicutes bacterium ADurb.Bin419]
MIIDVHSHLGYAKLYPDFFLDGIIDSIEDSLKAQIGPSYNKALIANIVRSTLNDIDGKKLIKQMDDSGISKAVLLMTDMAYNDESMPLEEAYKIHVGVKESFPDRFLVFFGIDPRREEKYIDLFESSVRDKGFSGLKLYPPCGFNLNDKRLMPYYEICAKYGVPVLTHTGASLVTMHNDYDYIGQIIELSNTYKDLKFILAHITFKDFQDNIKLVMKTDNVYFDLAAFQLDWNSEFLDQKIKTIFENIPEKILFGTDWPIYSMLGNQKRWVDFFKSHPLISEAHKDLLFYKNAEKIFKELR